MENLISIVIPTLNRPKHLLRCLNSLKDQTVLPDQVVVVDQSDNLETKELFEAFFFPERTHKTYVHQPQKSLILARNNGIRNASQTMDFICFLDDDLDLDRGFLEALREPFIRDTQNQYAGGMGTIIGAKRVRSWISSVFYLSQSGDGLFLPNGMPTFPHWKTEPCDVEFLSGGITMYRAQVLRENLFDEKLIGYGYGDDVDVSYRISRKYKLFYEPKAKTHHDEESSGRDPGFKHRKQMIQNFYYLLQKNVGVSPKSLWTFWMMVFGLAITDLYHLRKGALAGAIAGSFNILRGNLDSVTGYKDFLQELQRR